MGEKTLVESQIADAISLIEKLDLDGDSPSLTAWYYYDDADEWRLLVAGPTFDKLLQKHEPVAYRKLVETMAKLTLPSLAISDLKLITTGSPLSQTIRFLIRTGERGITRAHFTNTTINGIFVKEMIILRAS